MNKFSHSSVVKHGSTTELSKQVERGHVTAVQFILFNFANYSPSIAMKLKVSKEITCKLQKYSDFKRHSPFRKS